MKLIRSSVVLCAIGLALAPATNARADSVTLTPVKDNSLIEPSTMDLMSNGAGDGFFTGRTGNFDSETVRRAVLAFDVAAVVPAGSTITSATLTLTVLQAAPGSQSEPGSLHVVLSDWGEGESSTIGGFGAPPTTGDTTWMHAFWPDVFWSSEGGDFNPAASATTDMGAFGDDTWGSTAQMVADVQSWLDNPAQNFGWLILGNETETLTARKYASHDNEDDAIWPRLNIEFTPPPCQVDLDGDGDVGILDLLDLLAAWGPVPPGNPNANFDGDGMVGVTDLLVLLAAWGPCP